MLAGALGDDSRLAAELMDRLSQNRKDTSDALMEHWRQNHPTTRKIRLFISLAKTGLHSLLAATHLLLRALEEITDHLDANRGSHP